MGLAGVKVKQRFGSDPRNTNWSNDTDRFGHQYLEKMGWKPGKGLGLVEHAMTSHVKVSIKTDNTGLGSKLAKKKKNDEFDSGECAGLDVFQRILGRLNGKEEQINNELKRQRRENIINGKWGIHFVKGDTLKSTWDADCKKLISGQSRKRSRSDPDSDSSDSKRSRRKESKKEKKKVNTDKKSKKEKTKKEDKPEKREKSEKKSKTKESSKMVKSDKKEKKSKSRSEEDDSKRSKKDRKSKEKKLKKGKSEDIEEVTRESMLKPREEVKQEIATRLSARAKWIKQKRASVMDAKALNEIFMVAN
ncbi:hypothetical_protein [Candidozyma auris]|uniref:telomerase inhibitor n=1 Tax=Candidozyma auris TaxID=498019 RepID=UPI000D26FA56|nr:telomerase inhibitor [[Candida] auris]QEO22320.1 hypothetical_protein [[Candida] auris]GBL51269.1 hypothetical protein CAJCM15448_35430 [[Candida] auris]